MNPEMLLLSALALPVALLLACLSAGLRKIMPKLLWVAPVPALAAALFGTRNSPVVLSGEPYQVTLMLDASGSMLLTAASLLWIAAGFYAPAFFRREEPSLGALRSAGSSRSLEAWGFSSRRIS